MRPHADLGLITLAGLLLAPGVPACAGAHAGGRGAVPVRVVETADGYRLQRGGQTMQVRGAGGSRSLEVLASIGANATRTWSPDALERTVMGSDGVERTLIDEAHRLGLGVCAGFWMEHPRHEFSYDDERAVRAQLDRLRRFIIRYKDHPAILMWGIGNEVEIGADVEVVFAHLNEASKLVKSIDPYHPTMVVMAEVGTDKASTFARICPDVDILGINSYAGMGSLGKRLKEQGYEGPFLVTEYGPVGHWEAGATPWGAPYEQTSTEKAQTLEENYRATIESDPRCLGGFAFLWGWKQERTATWYGMWLDTGETLGAVDTLARLWTGRERANRAPTTSTIRVDLDPNAVAPGATMRAEVDLADPDDDPLEVRWIVRRESTERKKGGDREKAPEELRALRIASEGGRATVVVPDEPGAYRLFMYARDGKGNAATANIPFRVTK